MDQQSALAYARGIMDAGSSADDANIELVRMQGVRICTGKIPRQVRNALMSGVKSGRLGHFGKDGFKPEVFFHPNSEQRARHERNLIALSSINSIKKILGQ